MERYLYTAMGGALHTLTAQRIHANNLANAGTTGFRADMERVAAYQVEGAGFASKILAQEQAPTTDFTPGAMETTGRDLDLAIRGNGFLAVLDQTGNEAYTRAGNLSVDADGRLLADGKEVTGVDGPLQVPEYRSITIGQDGTVSVVPVGGNAVLQVGQLKLVNPAIASLQKGDDGLFRQQDGALAAADPNVVVESGHLEQSNVNAVDEMVNTLSLARTFEVQIRMMKTADELSASGSRLVRGA
ncbi:flagellar basal-body rod protein FlgF [Gallaecimonas xiamenensis]|uniref:Flagellar basal-body rod protein FlgF n=1 Tax=Gallaecimonas xiamenensis 3-C-1 TaxID=745411 RepID=K2JHC7_9GAMM|nr:flagellar basal-body rod protein FlgF [Gallaecimonas xiamenensis]EKE73977.1 FlgF flagellar basal-body rod protein [Gallaecimonas xiamenensis 3-C-1]